LKTAAPLASSDETANSARYNAACIVDRTVVFRAISRNVKRRRRRDIFRMLCLSPL
jgi:RNase P protein component